MTSGKAITILYTSHHIPGWNMLAAWGCKKLFLSHPRLNASANLVRCTALLERKCPWCYGMDVIYICWVADPKDVHYIWEWEKQNCLQSSITFQQGSLKFHILISSLPGYQVSEAYLPHIQDCMHLNSLGDMVHKNSDELFVVMHTIQTSISTIWIALVQFKPAH